MIINQDDKALLDLFKDKKQKEFAFTAIIKKYQEKLYWHIRRMVIVHEDADDVLQNLFLKAWKGLDSFREESQLSTWLYRIATNESLTFLDSKKRKFAYSLDAGDDEEGENYLSNSIKASEGFDANKLEWKLQLAIKQLPDRQQLVFNLRYFDELPYEEMSRILETSEGSLKASYHIAAKKIEDYILNK